MTAVCRRVKWRKANPKKEAARYAVKAAMKKGLIANKDCCEECGSSKGVVKHHDDYAKPLDVRWLCGVCHRAWHRIHGEGLNG